MARVLVVEDDEDIRNLVVLRLRSGGHQAVAVGDGAAALALLETREPPDVMVLDVGLPGMDGLTLLGAVRAHPGLQALPAIFLTSRVTEPDVARGRSMDATYLTKPFIASALLGAVERLTTAAPSDADW